jgi:hypothetical protein
LADGRRQRAALARMCSMSTTTSCSRGVGEQNGEIPNGVDPSDLESPRQRPLGLRTPWARPDLHHREDAWLAQIDAGAICQCRSCGAVTGPQEPRGNGRPAQDYNGVAWADLGPYQVLVMGFSGGSGSGTR